MNLQEQINSDIITAMKAKDEVAVRTLRALKSALLLAATASGAKDVVDNEQAIKIFTKLAKQRKESMDIFTQNGRSELAKAEEEELAVIDRFLPKQLTDEEIKIELTPLVSVWGATSASDFGKIMPLAMKHFAGRADGKVISGVIKALLENM